MNLRKIVSLTALITFLLELLNSVVLYIVPQGRIAYWADWRLWGLSKTQWTNLHLTLGTLFLIAIFLHIYFNWSAILAYLKNRAREVTLFTREFNLALLLTTLVILATFLELPPVYSIVSLSDAIKEKAARHYGEPPYGHAELSSLRVFSKKVQFDLQESLAKLRENNIQFSDENDSIAQIAARNHRSPQQIFELIRPEASTGQERAALPESPPPGFGNRQLADICHEFDFNIKLVIRGFAERSIKAAPEMSIKEIAAAHDMAPLDLYELLKEISAELQGN